MYWDQTCIWINLVHRQTWKSEVRPCFPTSHTEDRFLCDRVKKLCWNFLCIFSTTIGIIDSSDLVPGYHSTDQKSSETTCGWNLVCSRPLQEWGHYVPIAVCGRPDLRLSQCKTILHIFEQYSIWSYVKSLVLYIILVFSCVILSYDLNLYVSLMLHMWLSPHVFGSSTHQVIPTTGVHNRCPEQWNNFPICETPKLF